MKKVLSLVLAVCMIFTILPVGIMAESYDAVITNILVGGIIDGWEYCHDTISGKLYKQKDGVMINLFEEYTVTNVFTIDDIVYAWLCDDNGNTFMGNAISGILIEESDEGDSFELFATSNETEIFNFCINNMGLNVAATCAVLANIKCESSFNPNAKGDYQNGVHTSYGICQWHNSRYTNLINWCNNNGYDYTTLTGQLNFLKYELKNSYSYVWNKLTSVVNSAEGAYDAAAYWCARFEIPAGYGYWQNGQLYYGTTSIARGNSAKNTYWPKYKDTSADEKDVKYNASASLNYAKNHWNDGKGLCAEFVSDCLTAGGVNVNIVTTGSLKKYLLNNGYAVEYLLETTQGKRIKMSDHAGKISAGDVIINYCVECDVRPHVGLISGANSQGYVTYYAHNSAADGTKVWWNSSVGYSNHPNHTFETSVLHMIGSDSVPAHTHSFSAQYASAHPHTGYNVCSCGTKVELGTRLVYTCKDCYPVGIVSLSRSAEKTKGTATFFRNDVTNATKYTLTLKKDGNFYKDYNMHSEEYKVTGLTSGSYTATLTAYNENTGGSRSVTCYGFVIADTYTISYNANGGKNAPASHTKVQDDNNFKLKSEIPSREGYVFKGWAASKNAVEAQYAAGGSYTKNAKITLYAVWEPETYTINFDLNGGDGEIASVIITYGDTIKMPKSAVYQYHYLKGWSTDKNATEAKYKFDLDYKITENTTLYAVWGKSAWNGNVSGSLKGKGTEKEPFLISSEGDLAYLANKVNSQTSKPKYEYYKLTQNINLNYEEWTPIGIYDDEYQYFYGSFDGNEYTISDLYITNDNEFYVGLFGHVKDSEIENFTITGAIEGFSASGRLKVGAVAGYCENTSINECCVDHFSISGISGSVPFLYPHYMGGVVGHAQVGTITNCKVNESYIGLKNNRCEAGMIVGYSSADVDGCTVTSDYALFGATNNMDRYSMGGICGYSASTIKRCTVNAESLSNSLYINEESYIGGIVGRGTGSIEICAINFNGEAKTYTIDGKEYYSSIMAEGDDVGYTGGIAGLMFGGSKIVDCKYNGKSISNITGGNSYVGGMVGYAIAKNNAAVFVRGNYSNSQHLNYFSLPQKNGYVATWYKDDIFTEKYDFSSTVDSDITLYAKWEKGAPDIWDGSVSEPEYNAATKTYSITNGSELAWVAEVVNNSITTGVNLPDNKAFSGYTIELKNDICLNDTSDYDKWKNIPPLNQWNSIGNSSTRYFGGIFDGNNYSITGLYIAKPYPPIEVSYCGFIGYALNATITNVHIEKSYLAGSSGYVLGGIVGYAESSQILHCTTNVVTISSSNISGGIVGRADYSSIMYCSNEGESLSSILPDGGIVGDCRETNVKYCWNAAKVSGGGIASEVDNSEIAYCYNAGEISGEYSGGIIGLASGNINLKYCYNTADVSGTEYAGGLIGSWGCYSSKDTINVSDSYCNSTGIESADGYAGGLFGYIETNSFSTATIKYCYAREKTLYASDDNSKVKTTSAYYIMMADDFKNLSDLGFSTSTWGVDSTINDGYPYLKKLDNTYAIYTIVTETGEDNIAINRSFANIDGIVYSESKLNSYAGGLLGYSIGNAPRVALIQNVITMVDKVSSKSSGNSSEANSGSIIANNEGNSFSFSTTAYYASEMEVNAVNTASSEKAYVNDTGTERLMNTLGTSFYTTKMRLNPYVSLANLEKDETAVWVLKDGEIPELYYNVLNDITISKDIVNGTITADKAQGVDGEIVTVTATPAEGYVLNAIYVNGDEVSGSTFVIAGDSEIYATFSEKIAEYNVKIEANDNATGTIVNLDNSDAMMLFGETDNLTVNDGEEILINTNTEEDYAIETLRVNGEEVAGNNFIVTADSIVTMELVSIDTEVEAITNDVNEYDITTTTAAVSGTVLTEGEGVTRYIKYWATDDPSNVYTTKAISGNGDYSITIEELEPGTNYCYQMTEFGQIKYFTTISEESERTDVSDEEYEEIYGPDTIDVTGVTLNKSTLSLAKGESATLTATVAPTNATNKSVTWKSSNTSVATVTNGKVAATGAGSATITVTTADGGYKATCAVTVTEPVVGVTLNKTTLSLTTGESEVLTATVMPTNATNKSVTWKSSNTNVATVTSGKVIATGAGSAVITVTTADGEYSASCVVTVTEPIISPTEINLSAISINLHVGEYYQLNATVTPSNATDKTVSWSSSNEAVAIVSTTGFVVTVGEGTTVIVAKANGGNCNAFCLVNVTKKSVEETKASAIKFSSTTPLRLELEGELTGRVIVALYSDENELVEVKVFEAMKNITPDFEKTGSIVKAIWLESLSSMKPKCSAKEIVQK